MRDRIYDYLLDAVTDIFQKLQDKEGVSLGECSFETEYDISKACDALAEIMVRPFEGRE